MGMMMVVMVMMVVEHFPRVIYHIELSIRVTAGNAAIVGWRVATSIFF
jgi:hypothetical protein